MNDEILRIQKMVAEGKITPEEATELLASIGVEGVRSIPLVPPANPVIAKHEDGKSDSAAKACAISDKKRLLASILALFFGCFGAHRFYAGKPGTAILQLFSLGGLGIWAVVDLFIVVFGEFTDAQGKKIVAWT